MKTQYPKAQHKDADKLTVVDGNVIIPHLGVSVREIFGAAGQAHREAGGKGSLVFNIKLRTAVIGTIKLQETYNAAKE